MKPIKNRYFKGMELSHCIEFRSEIGDSFRIAMINACHAVQCDGMSVAEIEIPGEGTFIIEFTSEEATKS